MTLRVRWVLCILACAVIAGSGCGGSDPDAVSGSGLGSGGRNSFPETCLEVQENLVDAGDALSDGEYTLYVDGEEESPWTAYCRGLRWEEPEEYIVVDPDTNWSSASVDGGSPVVTKYSKLRFDPSTLKVDVTDAFGAKTSNWRDLGFADPARDDLPAGFAASAAGAGSAATGSIDLRGSGFVFHRSVATAWDSFLCADEGAAYVADANRARVRLSAYDPAAGALVFAAEACTGQDPWAAADLRWPLAYSGD